VADRTKNRISGQFATLSYYTAYEVQKQLAKRTVLFPMVLTADKYITHDCPQLTSFKGMTKTPYYQHFDIISACHVLGCMPAHP